MSRNTRRILTLADRMAAAGVDPVLVAEVQALVVGHAAQRGTNSLLWKDNMTLRKQVADLQAERQK